MVPHRRAIFRARAGRTPWAVLLFLVGFATLIVFVSFYYLMPAMKAALSAGPSQRRHLAAHSSLLMALILLILFIGLMITFRIGRFFFPRSAPPPAKTKYVAARAEAAQRVWVPADPDEAEDEA